jgi:hypothetical protein
MSSMTSAQVFAMTWLGLATLWSLGYLMVSLRSRRFGHGLFLGFVVMPALAYVPYVVFDPGGDFRSIVPFPWSIFWRLMAGQFSGSYSLAIVLVVCFAAGFMVARSDRFQRWLKDFK